MCHPILTPHPLENMHSPQQQPSQQQQQLQQQEQLPPNRCILASKVQASLPKTRSLPVMLSDYYIGAAPLTISRAQTTTAAMDAEDYFGTMKDRKARGTSSHDNRPFAKEDDRRKRLYAAAARAAAVCAAVIEVVPSDEDDVSKSTAVTAQSSPATAPSLSSPSSSSLSFLSSSPPTPTSSSSALVQALFAVARSLTSPMFRSSSSSSATLASPISPQVSKKQRQQAHCPKRQGNHLQTQAQQSPTPSHPLSTCSSLSHNLHSRHACRPENSALTTNPPPHRTTSFTPLSTTATSSPIVIHRSRSIAVFSSSASSALNISPVECHSLSPSTASPADLAYLTARKKRSLSLFAPLPPPSFKTKKSDRATQHYQAPDYLTAFFADIRPGASPRSSVVTTQDDRSPELSTPVTIDSSSWTILTLTSNQPSGDSQTQRLDHSRRLSLEPESQDTSPISPKFYSYHHKSPSNYQPIMIPRPRQDILSFLTTEQRKHGPSRSTRSTVSGGDWGEPSASGRHAHGMAPNSPGNGQDPWTLVTGSGSTNYHPTSPETSTPMSAREEQLRKLPPLQLLDRYEDTDPVLDLETAQQVRGEGEKMPF